MATHEDLLVKRLNPLIMKDGDGCAKPTYYDLPAAAHAYGLPNHPDAWGSKECVNGWLVGTRSKAAQTGQVDYKKYNMLAVKSPRSMAKTQSTPHLAGAMTEKEKHEAKIAQLTAAMKTPRPVLAAKKPKKLSKAVSIPDIVHGSVPARKIVKEDMKKIMNGEYEAESAAQCRILYRKHEDARNVAERLPQPTKASLGHATGSAARRAGLQAGGSGSRAEKGWTLKQFDKVTGTMKLQRDGSMLCFEKHSKH